MSSTSPSAESGSRRVGLLGGSFDPIHHGHLIAAAAAREVLALDEVRFVVAGRQPFKAAGHAATAEQRAAMVDAAIEGAEGFSVERAELDRPGPSYTVDTLRILTAREPSARFVLLVGSDSARHLPDWHEAAVLPVLAEIVVLSRPGTPVPSLPFPARVCAVPAVDVSSTAVRARVRQGLPVRWWVPEAVEEYVRTHRLYLDPV
ncbi:MAG: nicotinate-nucleotide adenylyltransferase [Gemmatimonadales bacterium]|nr:nicotinate-nucleotide adenylyltransferase [Gemmatimonadales bacterium]